MFWNKHIKSKQKTEYDNEAIRLHNIWSDAKRDLLYQLKEYIALKHTKEIVEGCDTIYSEEAESKYLDCQKSLTHAMGEYETARVRFNVYWNNYKQNLQYYSFCSVSETAVDVCKNHIYNLIYNK